MNAFLLFTHGMACLIALAIALCNINRMDTETHHGIRIAVALIAVGVFAGLASDVILQRVPSITEWLIVVGLASGLMSDRRRAHPHACPCAFVTLAGKDSHGHP